MTAFPVRLHSEYPSLFGSVFRDLERWIQEYDESLAGASSSLPVLSTDQNDDAYHVIAELPGFTEKDVKVDVHRGVVTVSGERSLSAPEGFRATHRERGAVKFSRSVRLPEDVDDSKVNATLKDGILSVTLPKRPEVKPRQIPVAAS